MQMNNNIVFAFIFFPALTFIFVYTKASILSFAYGISLCLVSQLALLIVYCVYKVQHTYRDSSPITITRNETLDPKKDFPFVKPPQNNEFYLNKYTEEARVSNKKNALKLAELEKEQDIQGFTHESPRAEAMNFLQEVRQIYNLLNKFNHSLIDFGAKLANIEQNGGIFSNRYFFDTFQAHYPSYVQLDELKDEERRVLVDLRIKLKMDPESSTVLMPSWRMLIECLKYVGDCFKKIEEMRRSNSQLLQMIHKKMMKDYQFIQEEIRRLGRSLDSICDNLESLKLDQQKLQIHQTSQTNESNIDMIYWLKKQFYQFTNMELRIKQNENNYKVQTEQLKCYRRKLASFNSEHKTKYSKVLQTRYVAFLDSYHITIEDSLASILRMFQQERMFSQELPPEVHQMLPKASMNETLQAELQYQAQHFQRVQFFLAKLRELMRCLNSVDAFLNQLKAALRGMIEGLDLREANKEHLNYFGKFYVQLENRSRKIYNQVSILCGTNQKLMEWNEPYLIQMKKSMETTMENSRLKLAQIDIRDGPIKYQYRLVKMRLEADNKILEDHIEKVKEFEDIYLLHTNRIKKILIVSLVNFLSVQKRYLNFGQVKTKYLAPESNENESISENEFDQHPPDEPMDPPEQALEMETIDNMDSGYFLAEEYRVLINRFLFAAYTEWKDSQFFKQTLSKEMYIAINEEQNDNFSQIKLEDFDLSGFPPEVVWVKQLKSDDNQFLADLNLAFRGQISLKIATTFRTVVDIGLELNINVEEFYCVLRLCFVNGEKGRSWFSFIGEPVAKFTIQPKIANYNFDMQSITNILHNILLKKLRRSIYPIREKISLPLSKKDNNFENIQRRFNSMRSNLFD